MGIAILLYLFILAFLVIVPMWKIYVKAGQPGWACLIPIYSTIVMLQIVRKPIWWFFMFLIPGVNLVFVIMTYNELSTAFGRGVGTTLGLLFLPIIFIPILGYGDARYQWQMLMNV